MRFWMLLGLLSAAVLCSPCQAVIRVDPADASFVKLAEMELESMRTGKRGIVCQSLVHRLEVATATTTIHPLTSDESTWHPNDLRGTRSHTVARDTRVRGADRTRPTGADIYVQPARVDPSMSLFKLGTLVHELSIAADLNEGNFSADFRTRERRASFYRNAWLDSLGFKPMTVSDRVPTPEYAEAKAKGLLTEQNIPFFPLLGPIPAASPLPSPAPAQ